MATRLLSRVVAAGRDASTQCSCLSGTFDFSNSLRIKCRMSSQLLETDTPIIALEECRRFMVECMEAVETPQAHAEALADLLVEADYRGHYSHGMNRLEKV